MNKYSMKIGENAAVSILESFDCKYGRILRVG